MYRPLRSKLDTCFQVKSGHRLKWSTSWVYHLLVDHTFVGQNIQTHESSSGWKERLHNDPFRASWDVKQMELF